VSKESATTAPTAGHREAGGVRELLLDTAERLFAEVGVGATSVRDITAAAGANVAAVNYYFGSREGLLRAVISRRMVPLNQERLCRLDGLGGEAPEVRALLEALALPAIDLCFEHPCFARLASRLRAELDPSLWQEYRQHQAEVMERFRAAFQTALPRLSPAELSTRLHYVLGGLQHVWAHCPLPASEPYEVVRDRFLHFFTAGMQAPGAG
jgi:AcrR family transcriptional regulator